MPFMQSILPGRIVHVDFGGVKPLKLGPGGRNAISSDILKVPSEYKNGDVVTSFAKVPTQTNGVLQMETAFAEPEGWGVISGKHSNAPRILHELWYSVKDMLT